MTVQYPQAQTASSIEGFLGTKGGSKLLIVLSGLAIGLVLFYLWFAKIEPVYGWLTGVQAWVASTIASFNLNSIGETVQAQFKENPMLLLTGVGTVGGLAFTWYERSQKLKAENLQLAAQQAEIAAKQQSGNLVTILNGKTVELEQTQAELDKLKATDWASKLEEAQLLVTQQASQITNLQGQVTGVQNQFTNFCKSLTSNNETVVGPAGEIYKVIKITETVVK